MEDPIARIDVEAPRGDFGHHGLVAVPEGDDVEGGILLQTGGCPSRQERRPSPVRRDRTRADLGPGTRDAFREPRSEIRVDPAKEPAGRPAAENQPQNAVPEVSCSESVTVGNEDGFALSADPHRLLVEVDADLLPEKVAPPPIVVPSHDEHRHSRLDEIRQKGEDPHVSGEDHPAVLEPEVEEIPVDDQTASGFPDVQEPAPEGLFGFGRNGAEVDIGDEEYGSGGHKDEASGPRKNPRGVLLILLAATGCAGSALRSAQPLPRPELDTEVRAAREAGRISKPVQLTFAWRAREPDFRDVGIGVARVEPPDKARLDLFLDNGETAAIVALVGDDLRVPGELPLELVPPPALLWAALGVFRPGDGAEVLEGRRGGGATELRFGLPGGDLIRFRMRDRRVVEAALLRGGAEVERVVVTGAGEASAYPSEATYRNLRDYRELELRLESLEHVDPFPPYIWDPGRR